MRNFAIYVFKIPILRWSCSKCHYLFWMNKLTMKWPATPDSRWILEGLKATSTISCLKWAFLHKLLFHVVIIVLNTPVKCVLIHKPIKFSQTYCFCHWQEQTLNFLLGIFYIHKLWSPEVKFLVSFSIDSLPYKSWLSLVSNYGLHVQS